MRSACDSGWIVSSIQIRLIEIVFPENRMHEGEGG